jgi:hypothetical protein
MPPKRVAPTPAARPTRVNLVNTNTAVANNASLRRIEAIAERIAKEHGQKKWDKKKLQPLPERKTPAAKPRKKVVAHKSTVHGPNPRAAPPKTKKTTAKRTGIPVNQKPKGIKQGGPQPVVTVTDKPSGIRIVSGGSVQGGDDEIVLYRGSVSKRLAHNLVIMNSHIPGAGWGLFAFNNNAKPDEVLFAYDKFNHPEHPAPGLICPYDPWPVPRYLDSTAVDKLKGPNNDFLSYALSIRDSKAGATYYANPYRPEDGYARYSNDPTFEYDPATKQASVNYKNKTMTNAELVSPQDKMTVNGVSYNLPRLPNNNVNIKDKKGNMLPTVLGAWLRVRRGHDIINGEEIYTFYGHGYWKHWRPEQVQKSLIISKKLDEARILYDEKRDRTYKAGYNANLDWDEELDAPDAPAPAPAPAPAAVKRKRVRAGPNRPGAAIRRAVRGRDMKHTPNQRGSARSHWVNRPCGSVPTVYKGKRGGYFYRRGNTRVYMSKPTDVNHFVQYRRCKHNNIPTKKK